MTFEGILHTSYVQDFFFKHSNEGWCHLVQKDGVAADYCTCSHVVFSSPLDINISLPLSFIPFIRPWRIHR